MPLNLSWPGLVTGVPLTERMLGVGAKPLLVADRGPFCDAEELW